MTYRCLLHKEAHEEYVKAYEWYELKQKGLGNKFRAFVEKKLLQISEHPKYYSKRYKNYREAKVENFPYMILFESFENKGLIHISAIYHAKRNPKRKFRRIR